jgi:hypothetical protein
VTAPPTKSADFLGDKLSCKLSTVGLISISDSDLLYFDKLVRDWSKMVVLLGGLVGQWNIAVEGQQDIPF